ncbi:preli-like [Dermatophagoides pteronyssinus]|uniref:PRELI domain-containing protein 1, mitochondrial n=1 Tax=Dermatophagoides pteronyssinus TaxID=6956 RepID=A0ABQ8JTU7_DERPT|nr:PRELI domain-containing protein 1, mitochondrial [Dermatophagoides pteronyssinus]
MTYFQYMQTFNYGWEQVAIAFWNRYPNPYSKHVLTEDVIHRRVNRDGRLFTKRLLMKTNSAPKWTERFLPANHVFIIEESIVDSKAKTLTTYTRNIGLQHLLTLEEKVVYKIDHEHQQQTICERQAWIQSAFYGLSSAIQRLGLERYKQNIKKAYKGFNLTLETIFDSVNRNKTIVDIGNSQLPIPSFNPIFKERLRQSATKASQFAKSNIPTVIAAAGSDDQD